MYVRIAPVSVTSIRGDTRSVRSGRRRRLPRFGLQIFDHGFHFPVFTLHLICNTCQFLHQRFHGLSFRTLLLFSSIHHLLHRKKTSDDNMIYDMWTKKKPSNRRGYLRISMWYAMKPIHFHVYLCDTWNTFPRKYTRWWMSRWANRIGKGRCM